MYEYIEVGFPFEEYVIYINKDEEFRITTSGEKIERNSSQFFQMLKEAGECESVGELYAYSGNITSIDMLIEI